MSENHFETDMQKVFVDVSSLLHYVKISNNYSGIQRVLTALILEMSQAIDPDCLYLSWCKNKRGEIACIRASDIPRESFLSAVEMRRVFYGGAAKNKELPPLKKYKHGSVKYYFHRTRLDLAGWMGKDAPFRGFDWTPELWAKARRDNSRGKRFQRLAGVPFPHVASVGDHLLLLDSSWEHTQAIAFKEAAKNGVKVHTFVHDLIPLNLPYCTDGGAPAGFYNWLLNTGDYTARYLTNSVATKRDLDTFFRSHDMERSCRAVPLAQAGFGHYKKCDSAVPATGPVASRICLDAYPQLEDEHEVDQSARGVFGAPFALCVGNMERRKNIWRLTMAWKYLLDRGNVDIPKLVFAGGKGWLRDDFDRLIEATGNLNGYVHIVDSPNDKTLEILYRNCTFSLMPSLYEGWGLPVGESLAYGKTAVVAANSSLVEVGQDLVEYCDASSVKSIAEAVLRLTDPKRRGELEQRIQDTQLRTWGDVSNDLLNTIFREA